MMLRKTLVMLAALLVLLSGTAAAGGEETTDEEPGEADATSHEEGDGDADDAPNEGGASGEDEGTNDRDGEEDPPGQPDPDQLIGTVLQSAEEAEQWVLRLLSDCSSGGNVPDPENNGSSSARSWQVTQHFFPWEFRVNVQKNEGVLIIETIGAWKGESLGLVLPAVAPGTFHFVITNHEEIDVACIVDALT